MKLLLTSAGFTNPTIIHTLKELTDAQFNKPFSQLKLIFVPTAANVEEGDKDWLIDDLKRTHDLGFDEMDIVDFSAIPKDIWEPKFRAADIIMVGGGNTFHLMMCMRKFGTDKALSEIIEQKVYVGISAGSMITSKDLALSQSAHVYSESIGEITADSGLGFVPFHIRPHLNSEWFPNVRVEKIAEQIKELDAPVYAIDDNCAIKVVDDKVKVVGGGVSKLFNK